MMNGAGLGDPERSGDTGRLEMPTAVWVNEYKHAEGLLRRPNAAGCSVFLCVSEHAGAPLPLSTSLSLPLTLA